MEKLVVLIGPTAVGKTKLSIELAKKLNAEIISGDSMQIYREMDIGTAKITKKEMDGVPHHLMDIKNYDESFSVAEFQQLVRNLITEIHRRGKMPMIVGGTGLYIQSVLYEYEFANAPNDEVYREHLEQLAKQDGAKVYQMLEQIDLESAKRIHPNNARRVIRALEIYHCTNKTMTEWQELQTKKLCYDVVLIGLTMDREKLYERINKRVDLMIEQGLLDEVKKLYDRNFFGQSIHAIGYKEMYDYFSGKRSLEEAVEQLKQNSRNYAKRQLTWFRNQLPVHWIDAESTEEIFRYIEGKM